MRIGPILEREMITLVRRKSAFLDRYYALALESGVVLLTAWVWDRWGWDRRSLAGTSAFAFALFVLTTVVLGSVTIGLVLSPISRAIASERDRKTLDALLATRLSAAGIVLGTLSAGLVRWANGLATIVPFLVLLVPFGGVDPRLLLLAGAGLTSTAFALAAIAIVASIVARTARQAISMAFLMLCLWIALPISVLILKPRLWPGGPAWIVRLAVFLLTSSPFGVVANLSGMARLGSPIQAVWRMIVLELIGSLLLVAWAIWQLRPRSRAHFDDETRIARRRILRAAKWRLPRPPCGVDPVLWNAVHSNRTASRLARALGQLINIVWIGMIVVVMAWFAFPAFKELAERGYVAAPEAFRLPDVNPLGRAVVGMLLMPAGGPAPGQARLEFNLVIKGFSACFAIFYGFAVFVGALESTWAERESDTWLGLLATPLSGWEIVRAKMLGALIRTRVALFMMIGLWTVGTLAGSIHPVGFVAAIVGMAVIGGFSAAIGVYSCLMATRRNDIMSLNSSIPYWLCLCSLAIMLPGRWSVLVAVASPSFLIYSSLFTYEDVHAMVHGYLLPTYAGLASGKPGLGARWVLTLWLIGILAQAAGAFAFMRAMFRGFDVMVGRPTRPAASTERSAFQRDASTCVEVEALDESDC